ncbi:hypothetical protein ACVWYQ_007210 [Bradyrhizobium sp. USDA 3397]
MRGIVLAVALLGMANGLQAKEADTPRAEMRSLAEPARQLATSSVGASRSDPEKSGQTERRSREFSPERLVPDICRGC